MFTQTPYCVDYRQASLFSDLKRTLQWSADLISFQFLNESRILVAAQSSEDVNGVAGRRDRRHDARYLLKGAATPRLLLCDISNFAEQSLSWLRVYKLPE